jgi:hypothetical protein
MRSQQAATRDDGAGDSGSERFEQLAFAAWFASAGRSSKLAEGQ